MMCYCGDYYLFIEYDMIGRYYTIYTIYDMYMYYRDMNYREESINIMSMRMEMNIMKLIES